MKKFLWHSLATTKQKIKFNYSENNICIIKNKWKLVILPVLLLLGVATKINAQLSTYPYTFDFTTALPSFVTPLTSGTSYSGTITNCSATVTGGINYTSSSKFWTFTATKCARLIYTLKETSTARGVTVSNDKNAVTKTTKGANNSCITDTVDFNYDGSAGNITIKFAGGSGGSGGAIIGISVYDAIVLPVTFTSFKIAQQDNAININWIVGSEVNINKYVIEKSTDAVVFNEIGSIGVEGSSSYTFIDVNNAANTTAYYRIKAVETNGTLIYSKTLKITINNSNSDILIGPNPIIDKRFALQLKSLPKANYNVHIFSSSGQLVYTIALNHLGGSASETIQLPSFIKKGIYTVSISNGQLKINKMLFISQ